MGCFIPKKEFLHHFSCDIKGIKNYDDSFDPKRLFFKNQIFQNDSLLIALLNPCILILRIISIQGLDNPVSMQVNVGKSGIANPQALQFSSK